jgi:hypothetical protein
MNNKEPAFTIIDREKDRQSIANQVEAFLAKGGKIEVLSSVFDRQTDPKCRVADDLNLFH